MTTEFPWERAHKGTNQDHWKRLRRTGRVESAMTGKVVIGGGFAD
jgi:hypothetical protein